MFQISLFDIEYKQAVQAAQKCGVEILILKVKWNSNGEASYICDDIHLDI